MFLRAKAVQTGESSLANVQGRPKLAYWRKFFPRSFSPPNRKKRSVSSQGQGPHPHCDHMLASCWARCSLPFYEPLDIKGQEFLKNNQAPLCIVNFLKF